MHIFSRTEQIYRDLYIGLKNCDRTTFFRFIYPLAGYPVFIRGRGMWTLECLYKGMIESDDLHE